MTSFRQIEANRRNARKSTGPITEEGKHRSRRNAVRHGLTAETVIEVLEDPEDYKAFELSVTADIDAQTAVEHELALRLASLLWRLRRATAIESGLLQIQSQILREIRQARVTQPQFRDRVVDALARLGEREPYIRPDAACSDRRVDYEPTSPHVEQDDLGGATASPHNTNTEIGRCFLRLANLDNGALDRLSRYETGLWRQVGQILFTLESLRRTR
jgi:hypothetical protein